MLFRFHFISFIMCCVEKHHDMRMNESAIKTMNTKWQERWRRRPHFRYL